MRRSGSFLLLAASLLLGAVALPDHPEWSLAAGRTRRAGDLISALRHDDGTTRAEAERQLVRLGASILPMLRAADRPDSDLETRLRLRRAARRIEFEAAPASEHDRRELLRSLAKRELPPRALLDRIGPSALQPLAARWSASGRSNVDLLATAVDHAARHGGPSAAPFLTRILGERRADYATLLAVGAALERLAGTPEIVTLRDMVEHESGLRRAIAIRVLFARGTASDLDLIAHHVHDPDRRVRIACSLLFWSPAHRHRARGLLKDRENDVRLAAAAVLAETGRESDTEALRGLLSDRFYRVRMIAIDGLARRGRLDAVAPLRSDPSTGVRLAVERAEARQGGASR